MKLFKVDMSFVTDRALINGDLTSKSQQKLLKPCTYSTYRKRGRKEKLLIHKGQLTYIYDACGHSCTVQIGLTEFVQAHSEILLLVTQSITVYMCVCVCVHVCVFMYVSMYVDLHVLYACMLVFVVCLIFIKFSLYISR